MMKVATIILFSAVSAALCEDGVVELNAKGCPVDSSVYKIMGHENCNEFYQCVAGEPVALTCPTGLMFNINLEVCDWANQVDCEERIKITTVPTDLNENPNEATAACARDGSDGLLMAHEYCNHLYMCARGTPVDIKCPEPLLYNTEFKYCDWESQVDCGERLKGNPTTTPEE